MPSIIKTDNSVSLKTRIKADAELKVAAMNEAERQPGISLGLPKIARPEDIANAVVYLSSDKLSGSITGQTLIIAGGMEGRTLWQANEIDPTLA
jgi:NAD(P)-dependent dehydrogenase (short-subunit alcohol dehydrogenase family)